MQIQVNEKKTVDAKTLRVRCKVCDSFAADLVAGDGVILRGQDEGYVPDFMPGQHYGDYLILDIDIETGRITNWDPPTAEQLEAFVDGDGDD